MGRVRDHIPLEQGLRLLITVLTSQRTGQRPYSIRTRIKTAAVARDAAVVAGQRPYSIRTRIKTKNSSSASPMLYLSETIFH